MRIIAGKYKNKLLSNIKNVDGLRPTTDKNRQMIFNIISSEKFLNNCNLSLSNANIADLCCGTGAIAFEALSRFAKTATLIDISYKNLLLSKKNAKILDCQDNCNFMLCDVANIDYNDVFFDILFLDPPYDANYIKILKSLIIKKWLKIGSVLIIEMTKYNQDFIEKKYHKYLVNNKIFKNNFESVQEALFLGINQHLQKELNTENIAIKIIDIRLSGDSLLLFSKIK